MKAEIKLTCLVSILILSSPVAGATSRNERVASGTVNIAVSSLLDTLDPRGAWHNIHFLCLQGYLSTLVNMGSSGRITSAIASRWDISSDQTLYTFHIDPGARFHDGSPVSANDVARSISRHFWPGSKSVIAGYLSKIIRGADLLKKEGIVSGIQVIDRRKLAIRLNHPYPPFLSVLAIPGGFGILKEGPNGIVGSGPMEVSADFARKTLVLTRKKTASGGNGELSRIVFQLFSDEKTVKDALQKGRIDMALGFADPDWTPASFGEGYSLIRSQTLGTLHLYANTSREVLKDQAIRGDLFNLLRTEFGKISNPGYFLEPTERLLPRGVMPSAYYQRRLGSPMSSDEFRSKWGAKVSGKTLRVFLRREYLNPVAAQRVSRVLKKAGYQSVVERMYIADLIQNVRSGDYDLMMMGYFGLIPDPDGFLEPMDESNPMRYGIYPSKDFFTSILGIRFLSPASVRLSEYGRVFEEFEGKQYVLPLYRLYFPILAHQDLVVPDTNYRFSLELTRLRWGARERADRGE